MAFFREKFSKLTGKWTVSSVSVSQYNSKRLAKDIEKESTVSYTDIMVPKTTWFERKVRSSLVIHGLC